MILLNYFIYILLYIIIYMSSNIFQINNNFDILPIQPNFNDKSKENMLKIYDFAPFLFLNKNDKLPKEFNNMNSLVNQYDDEKFQLYDFKLLEKQFFSNENVNLIQNKIKNIILQKMNIEIPNQNYEHIYAIMKDKYDYSAQYLSNNIDKQIYKLNTLVIDYCIKEIQIELKSYIKFLKDSTSPYNYLDRPQFVNNKFKTLPTLFQNMNNYQN